MIRLHVFDRHSAGGELDDELERLFQLDQVCFPPEIAYSRKELKHFLLHPKCTTWIAQDGEALAGFLMLERSNRRGRAVGHIVTLDVDPAQRRRRVGSLLMYAAEQRMQHEAIAVMRLEVAENNPEARHFYNSLGFSLIGHIAHYYGGRVNAEVMEKPVERPEAEPRLTV